MKQITVRPLALWAALALAMLLLEGCGSNGDDRLHSVSPVQAGSQLEEAFQNADPALQHNAQLAAEALRKRDYEKAVASLSAVQQGQNVTLEQGMAVQRSLIALERELIRAMESGDPQARRSYELLRRINRN